MKALSALALVILSMGPSIAPTVAAQFDRSGVVSLGSVPSIEIRPGESAWLELTLEVAAEYHIQANEPAGEFLVPLEIVIEPGVVQAGPPIYPEPELVWIEGQEDPWRVFRGEVTVRIPVEMPADASSGISVLRGVVRYQACSDRLCLAPEQQSFCAKILVGETVAAQVRTGRD